MLNVSVIQMKVDQGDVEANLSKGEEMIREAARRGSTLACLPEYWTTGVHLINNQSLCQTQDKTLDRLCQIAKENKIWTSGSMLLASAEGKASNAHVLINSNGEVVARYDKSHLFSLMGEEKYVQQGNKLQTATIDDQKIALSVCYDIRFPELFRSYALAGATMILSPMAFPYPRLDHWRHLVRARAIENQLFMVAANQIGVENFDFIGFGDVQFLGHSCIIDPWGKTIVEAGDNSEIILTAEINLQESIEIRNKMTVLKDRRTDIYDLD